MRTLLLGMLSLGLLTCCTALTQEAIYHPPVIRMSAPLAASPAATSAPKWSYPRYLGPGTPMDPRDEELLEQPINLDCPGVQIIEWRGSEGYERETSPSPEAIHALNQVCNLAFSNFHDFVRTREKIVEEAPQFTWFVCLMPALTEHGGRQRRNLNDHEIRFALRPTLDENLLYMGWTAHQRRKIFMRNDILFGDGTVNDEVIKIFAHELYHAMSWHYGLFTNVEEDEQLAVAFTEYLGLGT